jgi:hypothetical protein
MNQNLPTTEPSVFGCRDFRYVSALSRRDLLRVGGLGVFGLGLADLLAASSVYAGTKSDGSFGKAKACIILFMWGGPSQLDTWDPKPDAPVDVRGEFRTIRTKVPGIQISEHFPRLAQLTDKYAIIRSMTHDDPAHLSSVHHILTGRHAPKVKSDADPPSRRDSPHIGSVLASMRSKVQALPSFVTMPWIVSHPAAPGGVAPGQNAGWLGQVYDPFVVAGDPNASNFRVSGLSEPAEVSVTRLGSRKQLLASLDALKAREGSFSGFQQRALDLLCSPAAHKAFDISQEPEHVRSRYGRHIHGQCLLLARRLIEAGVRLVCINWHQDHHNFWDTHGNNFASLKDRLMPPADQGFSALLEDMEQRGLLDETIIAWVGEFGRSPIISRKNAGREHHPWCYSAVLAGGGIKGAQVFGRSDRLAAHPLENPVSPADLTATLYHALGIAPDRLIEDPDHRPMLLTEGAPVRELFV